MQDKRTRHYKTSRKVTKQALVLLSLLSLVVLYGYLKQPVELLNPLAHAQEGRALPPVAAPPAEPVLSDNPQLLDHYIGEAVDEFFEDRSQRSEMRMLMHCLAHRENGHAANRNCGDSGKSCGPYQFRVETWSRMRGQMIKAGLTSEVGDLYNLKESTRTTAWAIKNGRALEWGPIMRDAKGSDFATCQKPSFYK